jgi:LmbE family N-acetylglucosaminyl deacetylase
VDQDLANLFRGNRPFYLEKLPIPPTLRLVVLAPHPDDFDAIGVTMRFFHENGNRIDVAVVTSGASGVEDGFGGAVTAEAKGALRENEQQVSLRFFSLPENRLTFLRLAEDASGHPIENAANYERIRSYLAVMRPDLVFLPHGNDPNAGHQRTCAFSRRSAKEEKLSLVACLNRDPKTIAMREDLYCVFGRELAAWKGELLRHHKSQHQRNLNTRGYGFDERILKINRAIAETLGRPDAYAEAFELEWTSNP